MLWTVLPVSRLYIKGTSDIDSARYIHTNWLQTVPQWAMYTRQHSPLLLQVTSTKHGVGS